MHTPAPASASTPDGASDPPVAPDATSDPAPAPSLTSNPDSAAAPSGSGPPSPSNSHSRSPSPALAPSPAPARGQDSASAPSPPPAPTKDSPIAPSPASASIQDSTRAPSPAPIQDSTLAPSPAPAQDSSPTTTPAPSPAPAPIQDSTLAPSPAPAQDLSPAPSPAPAPIQDSTLAPSPAPAQDSSPAPSPAPAPAPIQDSTLTPSPAPAKDSSPTPTPAPTPTPTPAPTLAPTPTPAPAPALTPDPASASAPAPESALSSATTVPPTVADVEVEPALEKIEEEDSGPSFHCDLYDTEVSHKIAQALLPGLASACVDNTTGGIFKTPASVAVDMRKEMVEYLTQRSETFVADSVILEENLAEEVSDHPYDIISDFVDDFDVLKRNWFSRVSGWVLSERREDRIDDIVQEMELSKFWVIERREAVAQNLLKNVDLKSAFHCDMKFKTEEELAEHIPKCRFRTMICSSEGCNAQFIADHLEQHDSSCPFKIIPCEQGCPDSIMRREMDRHCITVCPRKLVNCLFYQVGCQSRVPQCSIEQHLSENLHDHLLYVLQSTRKEAPIDKLKSLVQQLVESPFRSQLEEANNARALLSAIKNVEAKIEPSEVYAVNVSNGNHTETPQPNSASPTTAQGEKTEMSIS